MIGKGRNRVALVIRNNAWPRPEPTPLLGFDVGVYLAPAIAIGTSRAMPVHEHEMSAAKY